MSKFFYLLAASCFVFGCGEPSDQTVVEPAPPPPKRKPGEHFPELSLLQAVEIAQAEVAKMGFDTSEYYLHSIRNDPQYWMLLWNQEITELQIDGHIFVLVDMKKKVLINPPSSYEQHTKFGARPRRLPERCVAPSLSIFEAVEIARTHVDDDDEELYLDSVGLVPAGQSKRFGGRVHWLIAWEKKEFTFGGGQFISVDMFGNVKTQRRF